jgi:hypothetical protein
MTMTVTADYGCIERQQSNSRNGSCYFVRSYQNCSSTTTRQHAAMTMTTGSKGDDQNAIAAWHDAQRTAAMCAIVTESQRHTTNTLKNSATMTMTITVTADYGCIERQQLSSRNGTSCNHFRNAAPQQHDSMQR